MKLNKLSSLTLVILSIVSMARAIELTERDELDNTPRVVKFDIERNQIRNPLAHDESRLKKRANTINANLENQQTLYSLNITIGTPAQRFTVNIDTGSSDLWVNSGTSKLCRSRSDPCADTGTYKANSSSTYKYVNSAFNISYAGGDTASGDYVTDTVRMAGQTITKLQFGVGYDSSSPLAILGIGYPINEAQSSNSGMKPYQNLPAKLAADNMISSNAYSLWLNDLDSNTGNLLFGGIDRSQYEGDLVTLPIQETDGVHAEFFVTLTGVSLNGSSLADNIALAALLDSGTSLTYLPNAMVAEIYETVDASFDEAQGAALVSCTLANEDVNMTFRFGDSISINVPLNELVLRNVDSGSGGGDGGEEDASQNACLFGIAPAGAGTNILGDTFLRSAYVVYDLDNNEISLAQSKFNATGSDIVEIGTGSGAVPSAVSATGTIVTATSGLPAAPTATETGGSENAAGMVSPSWAGLGASVLVVMGGFAGGFV